MISQITGNYFLRIKFGSDEVSLNPSAMEEFTITQDMNRFLPTIRIRLKDTTGAMTHLIPFDREMSVVHAEIRQSMEAQSMNSFTFDVYRLYPESAQGGTAYYELTGLLQAPGMFSPDPSRSWNTSIKTVLEQIAVEVGADSTEISPMLDYTKILVQPHWSNIQWLEYHKKNLVTSDGKGAFKCFLKRVNGKTVFVFKSIEELVQETLAYKFASGDRQVQDYYPAFSYEIIANYKLMEVFASKKQAYTYFNYTTGAFTSADLTYTDFLSLSDYFMIDTIDSENSNAYINTGRSTSFSSDFTGRVKASYYNRLNSLAKMWITTQGIENIAPGQIVRMVFPQGAPAGNIYSYQYSGYWMVERVVHTFGSTYRTRLLLTRPGLDTDRPTTLVRAARKRR
jgi:hypothetical protein